MFCAWSRLQLGSQRLLKHLDYALAPIGAEGRWGMSRRAFSLCLVAAWILSSTAFSQSFLGQYKGLPYQDSRYSGGPQKIPGKVLCAYYDLGGEGVAYHDADAKNHGSGELNPADGSYLNEFRIHEGVDTSYTKFNRKIGRASCRERV